MMDSPLFNSSSYITKKPPHSSLHPFPTIYLYLRALFVTIRSGYNTRTAPYTNETWIADSEQVVKALEHIGCTLNVQGLDNFHNLKEPCVFIANHMSTLETFVLPAIIQPWKDITFIVKSSLFKYPLFGNILKSKNAIALERKNPREDFITVLKQGTKILNTGTSIIVFPQSTRSITFDPKLFNSIGVKLARHANVPIIPLAIKSDAWGQGRIFKDFGKVDPKKSIRFLFSKPLHVRDTGKETHQQICTFIRDTLTHWNTLEEEQK